MLWWLLLVSNLYLSMRETLSGPRLEFSSTYGALQMLLTYLLTTYLLLPTTYGHNGLFDSETLGPLIRRSCRYYIRPRVRVIGLELGLGLDYRTLGLSTYNQTGIYRPSTTRTIRQSSRTTSTAAAFCPSSPATPPRNTMSIAKDEKMTTASTI